MSAQDRADLIDKLEEIGWDRKRALKDLGIPVSTYYNWKNSYRKNGIVGLEKRKPVANRVWNRLLESERLTVLRKAKDHPELSSRLLAVKITDEDGFNISESTVYRILKEENLIAPRPLEEMPASQEWHKKTTRVDEIWQCDATHMFVAGWGYYKYIPVLDDFSRKVLSDELHPDETAFSISDAIEIAHETAIKEGHSLNPPPVLLTDNGAGFVSDILAGYLKRYGIRQIHGKPYHPQTQGKVERFNRTIKQKTTYLIVYCSPEDLRQSIKQAVAEYNARPHESLQNVSPNDVYAGRKEEILKRRADLKKLTLERRKKYNLAIKAH